jgi:hypothetical protein
VIVDPNLKCGISSQHAHNCKMPLCMSSTRAIRVQCFRSSFSSSVVTNRVSGGRPRSLWQRCKSSFLWSSCRGFMRGVPVLASDSGYYPALWHASLRAELQAFKFTPSICRNNAWNSMTATDDFSLLDRAVSNYLKGLKEELLPA